MSVNIIAHYKIAGLLGRGGMAEVYEAIDTKTQQKIALKLLLPHLAAEDIIRRRFLREAKVCMELDHPGIVKVHDVGEFENRPYMAMEIVHGKTLEQAIDECTLDLNKCIDMGLMITDAIATAHDKKIVHRDIKPKNIMITDTGIKVMDFGLARVVESSPITEQHEIIGTLYYMSPEQAIGSVIDERSDIFSLGVVFYQMLTGKLPFTGDHPGTIIHAILYSDPLRMHELGIKVPLELEQVIFKTLRKKPLLRYNSVVELRSDLEKMHTVLKGKPTQLLATEEVFEESPRGIYSQLVGRDHEMAMLEEAVENMLKGNSSFVLVSGEAGIGKSRLVWELGRKAKSRQVRYVLARCLFGERGYPYQPVIDVLRDYFKFKGIREPEQIDEFIDEKASHLAARKSIIQSLVLLQPGKPLSLINKEQLWDTIAELVKVMAQDRPVVLHIDDLHWADPPTLSLLTYLAMNMRHEPLFIVGTYRPEDLIMEEGKRHPLETTVELLSKEGLQQELKLGRLDKEGTKSVVDSVFPGAEFLDPFYETVYKETEGNPLFILEVLKYVQDEEIVTKHETAWRITGEITDLSIPDRVTDVIMTRLRRLSPQNRDVLDVAAVEGYTFQSDTICHVLDLPRLDVLRRLQQLESAHHLVHALQQEYQFDHGKIQETISNLLPAEIKREYHNLIAGYFIKNYGNKNEYAGKIATHLIEAGEERKAIPYLLTAGQYAQKLYANEEAIAYFSRGLEIIGPTPPKHEGEDLIKTRFGLHRGRATVYQLIGNLDGSLHDYAQMQKIAEMTGDQKDLAEALRGQGTIHATKADHENAFACFDQAQQIFKNLGEKGGEASIITAYGVVYQDTGKFKEAIEAYSRALKIQEEIGDKNGQAWSNYHVGFLYWNAGRFDFMKPHLEKALLLAREIGNKEVEMLAAYRIGTYHFSVGNARRCLQDEETGLQIAEQIGDKHSENRILSSMGKALCTFGEGRRAMTYFERAMKILKEVWNKDEDYTLDCIGEVYNAWGDFEEAMDYFQRALKFQNRVGQKFFKCNTLNNISVIHYKRGDYGLALKYLDDAYKLQTAIGNYWAQGYVFGYLSDFYTLLYLPEKILEYTNNMQKCYDVIKSERLLPYIHLGHARYQYLRGNLNDADIQLQKALHLLKEQTLEAFLLEKCLLAGAELEMLRKDYKKASDYAEELLKVSYDKERKTDIAEASLMLARINYLMSDIPKTKSALKQAFEYGKKCGMKEVLWQAHHLQAKIYLKEKKESSAKVELKKAKQMLGAVVSNLSGEVKKLYLNRREVREFNKELKVVKKPTKASKRKPRKKPVAKTKKRVKKKERDKKKITGRKKSGVKRKKKEKRHGK
jgi:tetratricopeptide (TPR) repeat protein/tRNA A-37 threonylcarbamoyl transferase component Bud32